LHLAVRAEQVDVVRLLTKLTTRIVAATSERDDLVKLLLDCRERAAYIRGTNWQGMTALDIAKRRNQKRLVELLECCDVNWLELERQKSANSVNAILVGAALVATVTFAGLMQPPLGIPNQDSSSACYHLKLLFCSLV
jgi:ankyrin repeat protein